MNQLLLVEQMYLLKLLRDDLQQLQQLFQRLLPARPVSRDRLTSVRTNRWNREGLLIRRLNKRLQAKSLGWVEPPRAARDGVEKWRSNAKRGACHLMHLTSSVSRSIRTTPLFNHCKARIVDDDFASP